MKIPGTNTVDPIRGGVTLAPGSHPVTVISEEKLEDTDERLKMKLVMESIGGDEPGGRITDWWTVTTGSTPFILGQIEAFGVELPGDEFDWIPLVGKKAKIIVRKEPSRSDPSKEYSEVKAYSKLEDADLSAVTDAFDATPVDEAEDDIPF